PPPPPEVVFTCFWVSHLWSLQSNHFSSFGLQPNLHFSFGVLEIAPQILECGLLEEV
ncbi:unnamed protein product, partial [Ectocarpus sp. 4 AP-2014]